MVAAYPTPEACGLAAAGAAPPTAKGGPCRSAAGSPEV